LKKFHSKSLPVPFKEVIHTVDDFRAFTPSLKDTVKFLAL